MPPVDLIVYNIGALYTCAGPAPRRGDAMRELPMLPRAAIASHEGRIVYAGPENGLNGSVSDTPQARVIDAKRRAVVPGFVDPHTHLVFAGDRSAEFRERLSGTSYLEIAKRGGGILATVRETRDATVAELVESARPRLDHMLCHGTTTAEIKSGYGLTTGAEMNMLEAIRELELSHPMSLVSTFLGAHEIPPEYHERRSEYVDLVVNGMLPRVAESGLAEWCDVFCEVGIFSVEESRRILSAAKRHGLKLRLHADEFAASGGTELAIELGARSADHLMRISPEGIRAIARSDTVATVLPIASFYLKQYYAPARALVDAGAALALATDFNPGGGLSGSMPFAMTLACLGAGLWLEEALYASTVNAAFAVDRWGDVGSIETGKSMDAVLLAENDPACLLRVGANGIDTVIKAGKVVVEGGRLRRSAGS